MPRLEPANPSNSGTKHLTVPTFRLIHAFPKMKGLNEQNRANQGLQDFLNKRPNPDIQFCKEHREKKCLVAGQCHSLARILLKRYRDRLSYLILADCPDWQMRITPL